MTRHTERATKYQAKQSPPKTYSDDGISNLIINND